MGNCSVAVVFDLDGVLVDSEELWDVVRRGVAADAGRCWPASVTRALQGMSTAQWSAYLTDVVGVQAGPEEVAATVVDRMAAQYEVWLPLLPGAVEVVGWLGRRWPLGLASSSPRGLIGSVLESARLAQWFPVSVSTEEVGVGKPSPAVYQTARGGLVWRQDTHGRPPSAFGYGCHDAITRLVVSVGRWLRGGAVSFRVRIRLCFATRAGGATPLNEPAPWIEDRWPGDPAGPPTELRLALPSANQAPVA